MSPYYMGTLKQGEIEMKKTILAALFVSLFFIDYSISVAGDGNDMRRIEGQVYTLDRNINLRIYGTLPI